MASKRVAVEVADLSKRYMISSQEKHRYLGDALLEKLKNPFAKPAREEFWALKDVSFEVEPGDVLGVIGRNGAGKSTMLKILSGIAEPTAGEIRLYGKVGSLLEVGTGFHPELTGRENVFLNGTILGMRRKEVLEKFDEIVEFSEIGKFIDTPVKRYSSGMYVRLAFAVAANLTPEILIVDEVLAVGDAQFQAKCLGKMRDIAKGEGRTVFFVSHNMAAVRALCSKAAMLKQGRLEYFGDVDHAIELYGATALFSADTIVGRSQVLNEGIVLDRITVNGAETPDISVTPNDLTVEIVIQGRASRTLRARLGVVMMDSNAMPLGHFGEGLDTGVSPMVEAGPFEWRAHVRLPDNLNEGRYPVSLGIAEHNVQTYVSVESAFYLHYEGTPTGTGDPLRYSDGYGMLMLDGSVSRTEPVGETVR